MGKRNSQRKSAKMLDRDDDDSSSVSSSSTLRSDRMSAFGNDEVHIENESFLDESLDALYEKRGSTREKALSTIIEAFNSHLQHQFVENKFATLLHQCLSCIKRGSAKEVALAAHVVGLLAITVGCGDKAREMLEDSIPPLLQALKTISEASKISSVLECLAIITFVGGNDSEETEKAMEIMWQFLHPKLGSNVVAKKPTASEITAVVSSWSFLLTTMEGWRLDPKHWQECISHISTLLDKDDRSVRIAAGEALALIFEIGSLDKLSVETRGSNDVLEQDGNRSREGFSHIQGLKVKVLNQVRNLAVEAGGKGSAKKDLNRQRNLFKDLLEFIEDGYCPETSIKIGGDPLHTSTWSQLIQLNFLKHFLRGGFVKHMQENEFLHDVFGFMPKKKILSANEHVSGAEKRLYKSPNSAQNKARTQFLNKQRMLSEGRNVGHYAVNDGD